ncbi:hypothetical protein BST81_09150 [Leptolyngbya sp. 'hensonii']|nr:hypothetical protein BST81_09150 [Leptolyngbya sp. 'hensonii']
MLFHLLQLLLCPLPQLFVRIIEGAIAQQLDRFGMGGIVGEESFQSAKSRTMEIVKVLLHEWISFHDFTEQLKNAWCSWKLIRYSSHRCISY